MLAPTVQVKNGSYSGLYQKTYNQDYFLGIPFAQPPVGELRFNNPASLNSSWDEPLNATAYSPECYGYGGDTWILGNIISEDCLTLNVIQPSGINETADLPVGVWIHGGGSTMGGSADPRYNMSFIVDQSVKLGKPFIGVSINYRLQAFGFIWGTVVQDSGVSNLGIKDQRLALHWIQENIAAFGGDPSKVTVWGESAGASSIGWQLLAYGGRDDGLFRAAILESGSPVATLVTNASSWDLTMITSLRRLIAAQLLTHLPVCGSDVGRSDRWGFLPVLQGRNHDEGTMWGVKGLNTAEDFLTYYGSQGYDDESLPILAAVYPDIPEIGIPPTLKGRPASDSEYGQQWKRTSALVGDIRQHAPRRYINWRHHFAGVAWMFYNINGEGYHNAIANDPFEGVPESYIQAADVMSKMWISFIVDGTPNNSGLTEIEWPVYTLNDPRNLVFDANASDLLYVEPDTYRAEGIAFLIGRPSLLNLSSRNNFLHPIISNDDHWDQPRRSKATSSVQSNTRTSSLTHSHLPTTVVSINKYTMSQQDGMPNSRRALREAYTSDKILAASDAVIGQSPAGNCDHPVGESVGATSAAVNREGVEATSAADHREGVNTATGAADPGGAGDHASGNNDVPPMPGNRGHRFGAQFPPGSGHFHRHAPHFDHFFGGPRPFPHPGMVPPDGVLQLMCMDVLEDLCTESSKNRLFNTAIHESVEKLKKGDEISKGEIKILKAEIKRINKLLLKSECIGIALLVMFFLLSMVFTVAIMVLRKTKATN
ncbi:carboxylesterase family protein [Seiridium cupressi]